MEDLTNDIKKIKAPTLFLGATDKSKVLFGKGAEHIAQNMPDAKIVTVPRSHHGIHESNPRGFMNEIIKFRQESELPKPMRTIPAEKTVLRMDPPRRIDITDINYVDTGIGKWGTILYIHDINKSVAESSKEIAALKRQGFRVIAPDLRGHGNTISQGNSYSPTVLANDLDVLLKDLEVTKFHTVAMGQGQKVARELKRMRGNEIGKSIYMERIPSMREIMPNPRTIQRVLEEMPQVYNSSDELFNELRKHFSMSVSQAIQKALEIKKPNGDIVVNRAIPVRWFIDHDFNSHKVLRTVANNPNDEVKLGPGSTTKDMIKVVDKFIPTAKGARSWLRFLSP